MNVIKECRHGNMLCSDNDAYVGKSFVLYGEYSEEEASLLQQLVEPGQVAVEVGANVGGLTVPLAKRIGNKGIVLAFEPQKTAFYALCGNVFINNLKNVFCYQKALGDCCGVIHVPEIDYDIPGNYGCLSLIEENNNFNKIPNKLPVDMHTLDEFNLAECHLLKIDVEGMELNVLRGAERTIKKHKPVICVENDRGDKREQLLKFLEGFNYHCWQHFPKLFNEHNYYKNNENIFGPAVSANLVCFHKDSNKKLTDFQGFEFIAPNIKVNIVNR